MNPAAALRARLIRPPNAVLDSGINLRRPKGIRGYAIPEPQKPVHRVLLQMPPRRSGIEKTPQQPSYVWPGNLCGEFWLAESPEDIPKPPLTIKYIVASVASVFGVDPVDILSQRRHRHFVVPRQVAMTIARRLTLHSYPEIGRRLGGRDHTTCLHAVRKLQRVADEVAAELAGEGSVHAWAAAMKARLEA